MEKASDQEAQHRLDVLFQDIQEKLLVLLSFDKNKHESDHEDYYEDSDYPTTTSAETEKQLSEQTVLHDTKSFPDDERHAEESALHAAATLLCDDVISVEVNMIAEHVLIQTQSDDTAVRQVVAYLIEEEMHTLLVEIGDESLSENEMLAESAMRVAEEVVLCGVEEECWTVVREELAQHAAEEGEKRRREAARLVEDAERERDVMEKQSKAEQEAEREAEAARDKEAAEEEEKRRQASEEEAARLEEEAERARGIAEELRMAEDDAREKEAAEEEVKCRRVGEEEAARFGQEAEREMERAEVKAVEGEKIRDACYAVEEVKSQGRRRRDSDLQSQEMSPFAQKVSRPQVRRTQYHPPSKPRVSQVTKHESRVSGKLNWSSAGASHARMQSTSILRVRAQTNATELATELAAATERAASTHLTYGERGLRMQRQIAEINAIRSTLMKGRSLEPPARHKISPSATRSSYFEQVKARLVAEKQKRIHQQLHCRRRKLRELSSIYGDRHSSPGRR